MSRFTCQGLRAWLALAGVLALGSLVCLVAGTEAAWAWSRSEPWAVWRWWTAAWVHWHALHLLANLAGLLILVWLGWAARLPEVAAWAWAAAWPCTHVALWMAAEPDRYGGLSGVLHAGVGVAVVFLLAQRGATRWIGVSLLAGLLLKLSLEAPWLGALRPSSEWGFAVAVGAHAAGALAGLVLGAVACLVAHLQGSRRAGRGPQPPHSC